MFLISGDENLSSSVQEHFWIFLKHVMKNSYQLLSLPFLVYSMSLVHRHEDDAVLGSFAAEQGARHPTSS